MQVWFEAYPAEPQPVMQAIEIVMAQEDFQLAQHLADCGFAPHAFAWPLLKTFFTETFDKDEWSKFIDNLFLRYQNPEFLIYFLLAYIMQSRSQLLQINCVEDLHVWLTRPTSIPVTKLVPVALSLHKKYSKSVNLGNFAQALPLCSQTTGDVYPQFVRYPDHFVAFQNKLRNKIIAEEEEIERKADVLQELRRKADDILVQEEQLRN